MRDGLMKIANAMAAFSSVNNNLKATIKKVDATLRWANRDMRYLRPWHKRARIVCSNYLYGKRRGRPPAPPF